MSQNLPQICTASVWVNRKSVLKQMQYRFAVHFGDTQYCLEESVMDVDEPNPYFPQTEFLRFDQALKAKNIFLNIC